MAVIPAAALGPYGDQAEINWSFLIDSKANRINKIVIHSGGAVIDSIEFTIVGTDKTTSGYFKLGVPGGTPYEFDLDATEYLTNISGTYGKWKGGEFVTTLTFHTNKKTYGPYPSDPVTATDNVDFAPQVSGSVVNGFFGKESSQINSIGFYATPN